MVMRSPKRYLPQVLTLTAVFFSGLSQVSVLYVSILVQLSLAVLLGFLRGFGGPVRLFRVRSLGSLLYVLFGSRQVLFTGVP